MTILRGGISDDSSLEIMDRTKHYDYNNKPKRYLGLDLFRFLGFTLVVGFHLALSVRRAPGPMESNHDMLFLWPSLFDFEYIMALVESNGPLVIFSPHYVVTYGLMFIAVPLFLMLSGMFAFSKKSNENPWRSSLTRLYRVLVPFISVTGLSLVIGWIQNGGPELGYIMDSLQMLRVPSVYSELQFAIREKGMFMPDTIHLWYLWAMMGFVMVAPVFRPLFLSHEKETVRYLMGLGLLGSFLVPTLLSLVMLIGQSQPLVIDLADNMNLFEILTLLNPFFMMFLFGAWVTHDEKIGQWLLSIKYRNYGILLVISFLIMYVGVLTLVPLVLEYPVFRSNTYTFMGFYWPATIIPMIVLAFGFFYKLSWDISETSVLGKFILRYSRYTGRAYFIHFLVIAGFVALVNMMVQPMPLEMLGDPDVVSQQVFSNNGLVSGYTAMVYRFRMTYSHGLMQFVYYEGLVWMLSGVTIIIAMAVDRIPVLRRII